MDNLIKSDGDVTINQKLHLLTKENLCDLWRSVGWDSGDVDCAQRLLSAMYRSSNVWLAWDKKSGELIGLLSVMDDGLNAYISYLLVHSDYQGCGTGTLLMEKFKEHYADYRWKVITTKTQHYYKQQGFTNEKHGMSRSLPRTNQQ